MKKEKSMKSFPELNIIKKKNDIVSIRVGRTNSRKIGSIQFSSSGLVFFFLKTEIILEKTMNFFSILK